MTRRWPLLVAALYFFGGLAAWWRFQVSEDMVGALGLQMYVLPVSLVGYLLGKVFGAGSFLFVPASLPPATGNAVFFFPSLALLTWLVGWQFPALYRKLLDE